MTTQRYGTHPTLGHRTFRGQTRTGKWYREETKEVRYGTMTRRTIYYATEDLLIEAEQSGRLKWLQWE